MTYQHDDATIMAARELIAALEADSPLGNQAEAAKWARETAPDAARIAIQKTEAEEIPFEDANNGETKTYRQHQADAL